MNIFPAIDLLDGKVVRLAQGDYHRVTVYHEDPVQQARDFYEAGARWLHVVDLNAARSGKPSNTESIAAIVQQVPQLKVQVGGGMRTLAAIQTLLDTGVTRCVVGSKLALDPAFAREAVESFGGDNLVAGIDARDGIVAVDGWTNMSSIPAPELVADLAQLGLRHLVYTDISRDGMQTGIQPELYAAVATAAGFPVIVSGGVASLKDIEAAKELGPELIEGVIIGRAYYEGALSIEKAVEGLA
ncbi:MAG: 1-(5-phosphoribosyl)-5-[(5-phosphoribosylamino)methylideneamino]imidazole-4-carboxamide isomerase [Coriobacteriia bacterium]|nr:1-(5-phosphoribosyl)-5-[(5-phosphoribosylamino)methylideneamino]imidazole-4-carboxamide isomerase [Coriobacteriia bacterium]MCL2537383.1 1-(5-phosphoribosyl)-5-[(5-phosphoribosylamino)methylideneamino]imidazole-4-carboxamide isomerase [Coriobacteriia bacterium]